MLYNQNGKACVLDLKTGAAKEVLDFSVSSVGSSGGWGPTWGCKISPDGKRFAAQNNSYVIVCNIDGTNKQIIWTGSLGVDMIALSWDGNDKIYYSRKTKVVYTDINADNTAGATHDVITTAPRGGYGAWTAVQKSGDYISMDDPGNANGNLPVEYKISTGELKYISNSDACQVRMIFDGSGRFVGHESTHMAAATIFGWNGKVGSIPQVGSCGLNGFNFSYDGRYCIHVGDNDLNSHSECIRRCYIRKVSDWSSLYLGGYLYWPDIWIGTSAAQVDAPQIDPADVAFMDSVWISLSCPTSGTLLYYTINGQTPTENSAKYTTPFKVTSLTTIKAKAFKTGLSASNVAEKTFIKTILRNADTVSNFENGLWYKYYEGAWSTLPNFALLTPKDTGATTDFLLTKAQKANNFAFVFTGYIDVPQDGIYTFFLQSDDGSMLLIGDSVVVNHNGLHANTEVSGSLGLRIGKHRITVRYFDAGEVAALTVRYSMGTLVPKQTIPAGALYRIKNTPIPWIEILEPVQNQAVRLGDTLTVQWLYHGGKNFMVNANLSIDNGRSFPYSLNNSNAYFMLNSETGQIKFELPKETALITNSAKVNLADYNGQGLPATSAIFRIIAPGVLVTQEKGTGSKNGIFVLPLRDGIRLQGVVGRTVEVRFYTPSGKLARSLMEQSQGATSYRLYKQVHGIYLVRVLVNNAPAKTFLLAIPD